MVSRLLSIRKKKRKRTLRAEGEEAVRYRGKKSSAKVAQSAFGRPQLVFFLAAVGTAIIVLVTVFGQRGVMEVHALKRKIKATSEEIAHFENVNSGLKERIKNLKEDPFTVEQIAREELGLVKPGETVYEFVDEAHAPGPNDQHPR